MTQAVADVSATATDTPKATETPRSTSTPAPTATPRATNTPAATTAETTYRNQISSLSGSVGQRFDALSRLLSNPQATDAWLKSLTDASVAAVLELGLLQQVEPPTQRFQAFDDALDAATGLPGKTGPRGGWKRETVWQGKFGDTDGSSRLSAYVIDFASGSHPL